LLVVAVAVAVAVAVTVPPINPPDGDRNTCRLLLPKFDWLIEKRSRSVRDVLRATEATAAVWMWTSLGWMGWQFKHLPLTTLPGTSNGTILNSFFRKHFSPHVVHSPRFFRVSSSSAFDKTLPVLLKSNPIESIFALTSVRAVLWCLVVRACARVCVCVFLPDLSKIEGEREMDGRGMIRSKAPGCR
jgi:hypothetical protein